MDYLSGIISFAPSESWEFLKGGLVPPLKLRRRRRVKAFPQKRSQLQVGVGFCPQLGGVGPCPAQCVWQGSGFAADQTNAMLAVVRADDESLVPPQASGLALSVARPLPTETASLGFGGSPVGGGDKNSRVIFFTFLCGGGYHYPPAAVAVSEQPRAGFISAEKRFSQSGCSAPTNALFPPAHSAFWALLCGGGITTLGVRFMPLKRWARRSYGGLFTVFMPSRNSPCVG